jgi:ribonuclease HII
VLQKLIDDYAAQGKLVAGVDEVGRGPIFGPVVAAAVILPFDFYDPGINDSKQTTQTQRKKLVDIIKKNAISYSIAEVSAEDINKDGIQLCTWRAQRQAVNSLIPRADLTIVDGNLSIPHLESEQLTVIKADTKVLCVAAASILAKNYTDELMKILDVKYPQYGLKGNKGYTSEQHLEAIRQHGVTPLHRIGFKNVAKILGLEKQIRII